MAVPFAAGPMVRIRFPPALESAANFVSGREAWKVPRRRQGTIPTVSTSSGTDSSNPAPSTRESGANLSEPIEVHTLTKGWTGTRLIREWQGRTYEVVVLDDGFSGQSDQALALPVRPLGVLFGDRRHARHAAMAA